jgi:hypothetical protein
VHDAEATIGPFGPYRSWPPKPSVDEGETVIPGAPVLEVASIERERVDLVTGKTLALLENPPFSYVIVATHPESVSMSVHKDVFDTILITYQGVTILDTLALFVVL